MNKDSLIGMAAIALALIGLAAYALLHPLPAKTPGGSQDTSGLPSGSYSEHAQYYDIAANYATSTPLLASVGGSADAAAIARMKNFVASTISQFKTDGNFANLTSEDVKMMGLDQGRKETLNIVYLIASSSHTVSYIFTIYQDTLGAHGNTYFRTLTFNTRSGSLLSLSDIFLPGSNYLDSLSTLGRKLLPQNMGDMADSDMIARGTTPEEKNFQNFFFDNKDFVILFAPYEVAAYAAGPQTLRIPVSELANILRPDYR
jgi:hypothetical protein